MSDIDPTPTGASDRLSTDDADQSLLAAVRDVTADIVRVVRSTAMQATTGWSIPAIVGAVVPELADAYREREALRAEIDTLHADRLALEARLTESGQAGMMLEASLADARRRLERLQADAQTAAAREHQLREQLETVMASSQSDREETLRLAREMVDSAEATRATMATELETAHDALAAERASLTALRESRAQVEDGAVERENELVCARATIAELEEQRATTGAELERVRAKLAQTESELLAAQHEYHVSQVKLQAICDTHDEVVRDRDRLTQQIGDAAEREERLRACIRELEACSGSTPAGAVIDGAAALDRAREQERSLRAELAAAATASAATARVTLLQSELATAVDAATRREHATRSATAECHRLETTVATATARIGELERELAELRTHPTTTPTPIDVASEPSTTSPGTLEPEAADDAGVAIEPLATLETFTSHPILPAEAEIAGGAGAATSEPTYDTAVSDPTPRRLAVLDDTGWTASDGVSLAQLAVEPDTAESAPALDADLCLVNLAQPGSIAAAATLRTGGITPPLWGCAITAESPLGIAIGAFDVIARPIEPARVHQQLEGRIRPGATVVVVRSDGATLLALRQGLLQSGQSVRTAWTLAQAAELVGSLTTAVVVVDLAQEPARVAELCVDLARRDTPPLLVLLPGTSAQVEEFSTALRTLAETTGDVDRDGLIARARGITSGR